jgi:hypothetical protein
MDVEMVGGIDLPVEIPDDDLVVGQGGGRAEQRQRQGVK